MTLKSYLFMIVILLPLDKATNSSQPFIPN